MRFLFVLQYPGYLRYFDSVVRLLAERGHTVMLGFDSPHKQPEGADALRGATGDIVWLDRVPTRKGAWTAVAKAVRGTIDYARYLHPRFADSPYLRDRMRNALPPVSRLLARQTTWSEPATRGLIRALLILERSIPSSPRILRYLRKLEPDVVIVSPLVTDRCPQVDFVKSAKALGIPTALGVASWDHLTTKGLMRIEPDLVAVWNDEQKAEAVTFHGTSPERILVTGAQNFDRWFNRAPSLDREAFCRKVGLRADVPFVLFVGSTASISAPDAEIEFVRRWIAVIRAESNLADLGVLIRPHPYNATHWNDVDLSDLPNVTLYPRGGSNPVDEQDRADYFDSMYHSAAVVGVNTSAMIEAAIVGRTVHTVLAREFADTQAGTLHFRYLLPDKGGFLRVAESFEGHVQQLVATLRDPERSRRETRAFVERFVRPRGLDVEATPLLTGALETLARRARATPERMPVRLYPIRALLWLGGAVAVYRDWDRLRRSVRKWLSLRKQRWQGYLQRGRQRDKANGAPLSKKKQKLGERAG